MIHPIGRVDVLADEAFDVSARGVGAPPDHVHGQDVRGDDLIEPESKLVGAGLDGLAGRRLGMVEADVDAAQHEQERGDRLAHVIVDRRAAAIDVFPPGEQVGGPVANDLLVVNLRQVDLDRLGDKLGHGRPSPSQLVVVVHRRGGRVGAEHAGIGAVADVLRLDVPVPRKPANPWYTCGNCCGSGYSRLWRKRLRQGRPRRSGPYTALRYRSPPSCESISQRQRTWCSSQSTCRRWTMSLPSRLSSCDVSRACGFAPSLTAAPLLPAPRPGLGDVRLKTSKAISSKSGLWTKSVPDALG